MQKCYKCKLNKEIASFNKDTNRYTGVRRICKSCESKKNREKFLKNRDKILKRNRDYKKTEVGGFNHRKSNQKRRVLLKDKGNFTKEEWNNLLKISKNRCYCCKIKFSKKVKATIDHILPISLGGNNYIENIQPLCQSCNSKKQTQHIKYLGRKLIKNNL